MSRKSPRVPLPNLTADFLDDCRARNLSPRTVRWYDDKLTRFTEYAREQGVRYLEDADKRLLSRFLARDGSAAGPFTKNGYIESVKRLANWADKEGIVPAHPYTKLEKVKTPKDLPRVLDKVAVQRFLKACTGRTKLRDRAFAILLFDTGVRLSEALGITRDAIHAQDGYIVVRGKGNKERRVPVSEVALTAIRDYMRFERRPKDPEEPLIFLTYDGTPLASLKINFASHFREIAKRAGIPKANPHMWRHTAATEMLRNGMSAGEVQKTLGHEHLSTTEIYLHLVDEDVFKAHRKASPASNLLSNVR